ncbi:MAG: FecR domain-containing protein [Prolixibacteraceae bacterium]
MTNKIIEIANRFLAEKDCTNQELNELKVWLFNPANQPEVESWLVEHWATSAEIDSNTLIETVFQQIQEYEKDHRKNSGFSINRILRVYQNVAAFLLIPILGLGIWFGVSQLNTSSGQYTETIAPRGQKSQIVLADGTKVWLNSDTKIKYPGNFSKNQRDVYLDGEAFFEVAKNTRQPFVVHTSGVNVKVLGTKFNVKAYSDEDQIETSLFEGKVNLLVNNPETSGIIEKVVVPGQSFVYSKTGHDLTINRFPKDEINGWKKNQLIFKDDTFSNLVRKVERWYNVKVVYDEKLFNDRRLTVELYEGERLERLMDIISLTLSVDFKYEKGEIILTPKAKHM